MRARPAGWAMTHAGAIPLMSVDRLRTIMHDSTEHVDLVDLARAAIRESRRRTLRRALLTVLGVVALLPAVFILWTWLGATATSANDGCVRLGHTRSPCPPPIPAP